jgi:hypothetical protein
MTAQLPESPVPRRSPLLLCAAWAGLLCAAAPFVFQWYVGPQGHDVRTQALINFLSGVVGILAGFMGLSGLKSNGSLLTLPPVMIGFTLNGLCLVGAALMIAMR